MTDNRQPPAAEAAAGSLNAIGDSDVTKKQATMKARKISEEADRICARIRLEMAEDAKPCRRPFCINKRHHLSGSGKCIIKPAPPAA